MLKKISYIVLFLFVAKLFAQHPLYIHLTEKDGLPDIEFYDIIEDQKGFIWLAADKGLYRYDGKTFKNYTHPKKKGLSVFGLKFDNKGRLWCNNISGQYFYIENDSLKLFTDLKHHIGGQLNTFFFYKKELIVNSFLKLLRVDLKTKEVNYITDKNETISNSFKNGDTIFKINGKRLMYSIHNYSFREKQVIMKENYSFNWGHSYIKDDLLLFGYDYINEEETLLLSNKGTFEKLVLSHYNTKDKIVNIYIDDDLIWFLTQGGIHIYQYTSNRLNYITTFFKGEEITNVIKDQKDNYWISTLRSGIYIIPNKHIQNYTLPKGFENITAIEKIANNTIIIGSTKGKLAVINTETNKVNVLDSLSNKKIFTIANNGAEEVYISSTNKSYILDKTKNYKIKRNKNGEFMQFSNAKDISVLDDKKFVTAAFGSAYIWDRDIANSTLLNRKRSYTCHYSNQKKAIYVGYVDGVERYKSDLKPNKILFNNSPIFAIDIDETEDGSIWISTFKDGIIGVKNGKAVENYTVNNGLLSNQTSTIKADGHFLWIVTDKSIQRLDTKSKTFENLTKKDGITSFNISDVVVLNDKVCFGSNKGLFQINKKDVFKQQPLLDFYFTHVLVEDESVEIKSSYNLPSDVNKIQFQFHTNGFLSEEDMRYQYRLKGASDLWSYVDDNAQHVTFNNLSVGKYDFQLKGIGTRENKETPVKSIQIKINQPFYKEWWFISTAVIIGGLVIIGYYRNKLKIKENEKQLQLEKAAKDREMVFLKLENLRSQMIPHFIFNSLNSIQEYILLIQKNLSCDYLGKFADLKRMYLNHSTKGTITLSEEIEALNQYLDLEKLRFEDSLDYQIQLPNGIDLEAIEIPTMLIQPYVENALKHGLLHRKGNRILSIKFKLDDFERNLICLVEDNGVGRKKAKALSLKRAKSHLSFGTKITQNRLDLLNQGNTNKIVIKIEDVYSQAQEAIGTRVHITIPITNT